MPWSKFDDKSANHPKMKRACAKAGDSAWTMWSRAIIYSNEYGTDGHIDDAVLADLTHARSPEAVAKILESERLFERVDGGYIVHDFLDWNPSAEEWQERRSARSKAGSSGGKKSGQSRKAKQNASKPEASASPLLDGCLPFASHMREAKRNPGPGPIEDPSGGSVPASPGTPPPVVVHSPDGEAPPGEVWRLWREAYGRRYSGGYTGSPSGDGKAMADVLRAARDTARQFAPAGMDPTVAARAVCQHWFERYVADNGYRGWLAEHRHPLRNLTRDLTKYGHPWASHEDETDDPDETPFVRRQREVAERILTEMHGERARGN